MKNSTCKGEKQTPGMSDYENSDFLGNFMWCPVSRCLDIVPRTKCTWNSVQINSFWFCAVFCTEQNHHHTKKIRDNVVHCAAPDFLHTYT